MDSTEFLTQTAFEELVADCLRTHRGQAPSMVAHEVAEMVYKYYSRMAFEVEQLTRELNLESELQNIS